MEEEEGLALRLLQVMVSCCFLSSYSLRMLLMLAQPTRRLRAVSVWCVWCVREGGYGVCVCVVCEGGGIWDVGGGY